ncbi:MAG TPA: integrin alpha [Blastocatellia bacterium]|nr:integrin alpha [Blastocatellia bacterium]
MSFGRIAPVRRARYLVIVLAGVILAIAAGTVPFRATTADVTTQIVQLVDLSAGGANIQMLGAGEADHFSGNNSANSFSSFPRSHALAAGDINNDGIRDLIVGAPDVDFTPQGGSTREDAGAVYILFGRATFASPTIIDTNTTAISQPDVKIFGANSGDNLGFAVAAGDVNGDGIDDLAIGAPGFDLTGAGVPVPRSNTGSVFIIFGATGFTPRTVDLGAPNAANDQIIGEQAGDRLGNALTIGEVNGDASPPDLLIGATGSKGPDPAGAARNNAGAAFLLLGGATFANPNATTKVIDLNTSPAPVRIFGKAESLLGTTVALGDVNGGGVGDLLVGAPKANRPDAVEVGETGATFGVFGGNNLNPTPPAATKTFDLSNTQQNLSIYGEVSGDHLGSSIAIGNVTNEGASDIIIGAPQSAGPGGVRPQCGQAYVIAGSAALNPVGGATERRITVSLSTAALSVIGAAPGDRLGSAVAAGVVNTQGNNDSVPDVLLGAPGALSNRGSVHVLFGGSNLLIFPGRDLALNQDDVRITGQAPADEFGWTIGTGDFDNNRGGDIAAGAPFNDVQIAQGAARSDAGKAYVLLAAASSVPPQNHAPTVELTAPNGGELVGGGGMFEIKWTAGDQDGEDTIQGFELRLSTDGGSTFNTIIAPNIAGATRTFGWNIPIGVNTTTARVRITATDNTALITQDDSNADFTISDTGVALAVTSPNGNETLRFGQTFKITWVVGTGFGDQVKGFDIFYTTDNGLTFTPITQVNPTNPALPPTAIDFNWVVPSFCTSTAKVVVSATSKTNAVSSDFSNSTFFINDLGPQVDTSAMSLTEGATKINFRIVSGGQPRFLAGVKVELSNDQAGSQFFEVLRPKTKSGGKKLLTRGSVNGQDVGVFFPDAAHRILRFTNPTCGTTILRVFRAGDSLTLEPGVQDGTPVWQ